MKKLIMIAAALCCAVAANAATLNWGTEWVYSTDWDNGTAAGSAWLVWLDGDGTGVITVDDTGVLNVGNNTLVGSGNDSVIGGMMDFQNSSGDPATWNGRSLVMVAYDSGTQFYGISDIWVVAGLTDTPAPNVILNNFGNDGDNYMQLNIEAVPEPTSFALLGLGAAALALRRRLRKA